MEEVKEVSIRNKNIYKKTKAEKIKLKSIKANLSIPFMNKTIIHIGADSDISEIVTNINNSKLKS